MEGTDPEKGTEEQKEGNWSGGEEDGILQYPGECHRNGEDEARAERDGCFHYRGIVSRW